MPETSLNCAVRPKHPPDGAALDIGRLHVIRGGDGGAQCSSSGDVTSIDYPVGTADVTLQYDAVRNLTQMVDGTGTSSYVYDAVNRLTSATFPGSRTVSYTYDNPGRRATITYPGGSNQVTYGYDAANNLTSVTDWNSDQTTYGYNNAGMLTTITLPTATGVVGTISYDNADRQTGISWVKGGSQTLASVTYTLDATGRRTQRADGLGTHTYQYDALYRLTSVTYPGPTTDTYTYDSVGNRLTKNATSLTYDAADRLTSVGASSYTFDDNGSLTARGSDSFNWDATNRLTSATVGGTTTTFAYRGGGLRDSLTTGGNTKTFTWDVASGIPQVLDDGSFKYVYGFGHTSEVGPGTTTHFYLTDALGSVMALIDSSGNIVNTYNYDAFGAIRSSIGSQANAFTFTGEQTDASTSLEYLRARYYDPAVGQFISRDPYAGSVGSPSSQNRYSYAEGDPVGNTDPLGLCLSARTKAKIAEYQNPFKSGGGGHRRFEEERQRYASMETCKPVKLVIHEPGQDWTNPSENPWTPAEAKTFDREEFLKQSHQTWLAQEKLKEAAKKKAPFEKLLKLLGTDCASAAVSVATTVVGVAPGSGRFTAPIAGAYAANAAANGDEIGAALNTIAAAGDIVSLAVPPVVGAVVNVASSLPSAVYSVGQCANTW